MVQVRKDVNHVIAPGKAKLFQGRLQRKSAGSSQSGADHLDWHGHLTMDNSPASFSHGREDGQSEAWPRTNGRLRQGWSRVNSIGVA